MKVKVRYCGGCNSAYDRAGLVDKLRRDFPLLDFLVTAPFDSGINTGADFTLVVCGCPVRCAAREDLAEACESLTVSSPADFLAVYRRLEK
jgi:hypothetical protein